MTKLGLILLGFVVILVSYILMYLSAFQQVRRLRSALTGLLVGRAMHKTNLNRPWANRFARWLGVDTSGSALQGEALEALRPSQTQEKFGKLCLAGMILGAGLIVYAIFRS